MKLKFLLVLFVLYIQNIKAKKNDEQVALMMVNDICDNMLKNSYRATLTSWAHASNITDHNEKMNAIEQEKYATFLKKSASDLSIFDYESFKNATLKRLMKSLVRIGDAKLNEVEFRALKDSVTRMQGTYAKVKIPSYKGSSKMMNLEPEITEILIKSNDPEELKYYWTQWYDHAGTPSKKDFFKYAMLRNKAARLNGYKNGAEQWLNPYEDPTFEKQIENILEQLHPLYLQFHAYVRHRLNEIYGDKVVDKKRPIPMHVLGNMWAQTWNIDGLILPYKVEKEDIDSEMINLKYTPKKMFEDAEQFFTSIDLSPMPASFWEKSIIEKPNDGRELICHASAWDFKMYDDVRIKQCTRVSFESYTTVHHEMGHIEYYLQYKHLPMPFRTGANPGFHEAIGDTIALSVQSPKHLHKIGFIKTINKDKKSQINQLFKMGLDKLPFLPFAYAFDKYRYEVFRGNVKEDNANDFFWYLRLKHGGVVPPVRRTNDDFDIPAKYHGSGDVEYLRYFVSFILQFQFHKAACIKANEYEKGNPDKSLADCDIYESKEAGNAIKKMLALGSSVPWNDALEVMTGERKLDANALLEYFEPLNQWLKDENKKLNAHVGW